MPARVFLQLFLTPVLEVEGRVRHNEIKALHCVQVVEKRICVVFAEVRVDAADGHVHFCHFPGVGVGLLSVNAYIVAVAAMVLDKLDALHEHAAGASPVTRLARQPWLDKALQPWSPSLPRGSNRRK